MSFKYHERDTMGDCGNSRKESSFKLRSLQARWGDGRRHSGRRYCVLEPELEPARGTCRPCTWAEKWGRDHCAGKLLKKPARARMQTWREYKSGKTELLVCVLFQSHPGGCCRHKL